jgi:hypothetical protein
MSKSSAISSAAAKVAPPPQAKPKPKPAPAKTSVTKGKRAPGTDVAKDLEKTSPAPPSEDSKLSSLSHSSTLGDSFSYSKEGYGSRKVTTDSTTRLVDSLVETYTGEHSGIESHEHNSFARDTSSRTLSSYSEHGHDCPHSPSTTRERFQRLDEAGQQLSQAQKNVEQIMDRAVEARVNDEKPVPESEEKRAEAEYERLTKAEGRLHRTKQTLSEKQEFRRQRKLQFKSQQQSAENALLSKFRDADSALRDHMMETFRPVIAKDDQARNDHKQLEAAAEWHLKNDSKAARLAREGSSVEGKSPEESKREVLEKRLQRQEFKETVRNASGSERTQLVEKELKKLDKSTATQQRRELETQLNKQLSEVQLEETKTSHKEDDKRRNAVDTLLESKSQRAGKAGQALNPIAQAVDDLDHESVRKTHKTLEDMDLDSVTSVLDLERALGRNLNEVKNDLEQQVRRGGGSVTKARKTLKRLDKIGRRSRLLGEADSWDALLQCIAPTGPKLGGFLGLPESWSGRQQAAPAFENSSRVDAKGASRIARRIARSGGKLEDRGRLEALNRFGYVG